MKISTRLVVVAMLAIAGPSIADDDMSDHFDVIVVGLGAAGTVAASELARAGKRVLALEAMFRVGGRVWTLPFGKGQGVFELGAEWIHGQNSSYTYRTATEHNLPIKSQDLSFDVYRSDGSRASDEMLDIISKGVEYIEESKVERPQPVGEVVTNKLMDYIKEKHPSLSNDKDNIPRVLDYLDLYVDGMDASDSWMQVDAAAPYEVLGGDQHCSWHKLGYKTFFEILLNTYNGGPGLPSLTTRLSTAVTRVQWPQTSRDPVKVTVDYGHEYTADAVIVTPSLGVLKEKHATLFSPPLPADKVSAIEKLDMGVVGKLILTFEQPWWPNKFHTFLWKSEDLKSVPEADRWTTRILGFSPSMGYEKTVTLWTVGESAKLVETLPKDEVQKKAVALLRRFLGGNMTIPDPTSMIRSEWYTNQWTRGSYSYSGLAASRWPRARRSLAAPVRDDRGRVRLLLAGEAAHATRYSTVHGAADSGHAAASVLLAMGKAA